AVPEARVRRARAPRRTRARDPDTAHRGGGDVGRSEGGPGAVAAHVRRRPHGEPRRRRADRGADPRDGAAQDGHARLRSPEDRERYRHRAAAARCQERPAGDRAHQRLHPLRRRGALHRQRRRRRARRARAQDPRVRLEGLWHAVLRHLPTVRRRLLQDRSAALQSRRGVAHERGERQDVSRRSPEPRRVARVARRELRRRARGNPQLEGAIFMHRALPSLAALTLVGACARPQPAAPGAQWAVIVLYNQPKDTAAFEKYYAEKHIPLFAAHAKEIGVTRAELVKFAVTIDGQAPALYREADLRFESREALEKGIATP